VVLFGYSFVRTDRLKTALRSKTATKHVPMAIQALMLSVQAGELMRVVEHTTLVNVVAALLLLTILIAARSGTEAGVE